MILCRNCSHQEIAGALFCSDCGARLNLDDQIEPASTQMVEAISTQDNLGSTRDFDETIPPEAVPIVEGTGQFAMQVLDIGETIPFEGKDDFTLGRASEGQPLIPEIDLNAYNAYEQGVSRMHAVITVRGDRVTITDLGSANGTWVNGDRVSPHTARVLNHGDLVTLGKFRLQALMSS